MNNITYNKRMIQVKYLGATNHRGSRIQLTENRYNTTDRKTLSFDYGIGDGVEQAILYLTDKGIAIESKGQFGGLTYIVSPSWADDKEFKSIK